MPDNKNGIGKSTKYTGRPRKYETPEEMQKVIEKYFMECAEDGIYPTVSMLAFRLGLSRDTLLRYEKSADCGNGYCDNYALVNANDKVKHGFQDTIRKAKAYIEAMYENKMINTNTNIIGLIFSMKNNYNWVDKQEIVQENKTITVDIEEDEE